MPAIDEDEDAPAEEFANDNVSRHLHDWVLSHPGLKGVRGSYDTNASFKNTHSFAQDFYVFHSDPVWLRRCCEPKMDGTTITTVEELDPFRYHLHGTRVFVYNPWWYKPLWPNSQARTPSSCMFMLMYVFICLGTGN